MAWRQEDAQGQGGLAADANDLAYQTGQFMLAAGALFLGRTPARPPSLIRFPYDPAG